MNTAERLVEILEENGINHIFGIPGEQIMPMYKALSKSNIKHILTRHEQAAAHAADGYSRSSGKIGVCISTASPGALNFTMALATAFKDNVPILVLTGDNDVSLRKTDYFQSLPVQDIFSDIVYESYSPLNGTEALYCLKAALFSLKNNPKGPVHINLSRDVLMSEEFEDFDLCYLCENDMSAIGDAQEFLNDSEKPVFLLGAGALQYHDELKMISKKNNIPIMTTYNARGFLPSDDELNFGMCGIRGTKRANYALNSSDCIIALGTRLSERTAPELDWEKLIHVNLNNDHLKGKFKIHGNIGDFLADFSFKKVDWLDELKITETLKINGLDDDLSPQAAIKRILEKFPNEIILGDAGSLVTWVTLLHNADEPRRLLFSGGLAPMGYALPASIGSTLATGLKSIVVNGDGDVQMNIQELVTIAENNLDIIVFILNNSEFGIIRQWQEDFYDMDAYEVKLNNPDFVKLAASYGIDSVKVDNLFDLEYLLENELKGPLVVEVVVRSENIPMPSEN